MAHIIPCNREPTAEERAEVRRAARMLIEVRARQRARLRAFREARHRGSGRTDEERAAVDADDRAGRHLRALLGTMILGVGPVLVDGHLLVSTVGGPREPGLDLYKIDDYPDWSEP
jgi:hypothetical protein